GISTHRLTSIHFPHNWASLVPFQDTSYSHCVSVFSSAEMCAQQLSCSILALLGLLGPTIRAEVYDTVVVTFKNLASHTFSLHAVGVTYRKASEGKSGYDDETSRAEKEDDEVGPGKTHTYVWEILEDQGPTESDSPCLTYSYFSYTDSVKDINSGLIGALLVCRPGKGHGNQKNKWSWYHEPSHRETPQPMAQLHTINGYVNGSLPDLRLCQKRPVYWHVIGLGTAPEVHSIFFEGHTFLVRSHRHTTLEISPATFLTAQTMPTSSGRFLMFCQIPAHQQGNISQPRGWVSSGKGQWAGIRDVLTWLHYIAAEEVEWDYAPTTSTYLDRSYTRQFLEAGTQRIGLKYKKVMFVEYEDGSFKKRKLSDQRDTGILGPVLKGEVGDQFTIVFKNLASRPYNIYPHGLTSIGSDHPVKSYEGETGRGKSLEFSRAVYRWKVTMEDGPGGSDPRCLTRFYYSSINPVKDTASGLIGPLLLCSKASMDQRGNQMMSDETRFLLFSVFDENHSWYLAENIQRLFRDPATVNPQDPEFYAANVIPSINGYVFDNLHLKLCLYQVVYWYILSVGAQTDFLSVFFSGNTFKHNMVFEDTLTLFPFSGETVYMSMEKPGYNPERVTEEFDIYGEDNQDMRTFTGRVRQYFIAAVEVLWDPDSNIHAPPFHSASMASAFPKGWVLSCFCRGPKKGWRKYKKVIFRGYLDNSFTQPLAQGELDEHLGILGPYIRAEVDDVVMVSFKNLASRPYSFHSNLLSYQGSDTISSQEAVQPGELREYSWKVLPQMAPTADEFDCKAWAYFSSVDLEKDLHSGLVGPLLICRPGVLSLAFGRQLAVQEFSLLFTIFDETKSWYLTENMERNCPPLCQIQRDDPIFRKNTYFHAINGYVMDALPGLVMAQHQRVRWHLLNVGGTKDIHSVYFHGQLFSVRTNHEYRMGVYNLYPVSNSSTLIGPKSFLSNCAGCDEITPGTNLTQSVMVWLRLRKEGARHPCLPWAVLYSMSGLTANGITAAQSSLSISEASVQAGVGVATAGCTAARKK
uniref:Coagulation factor VIII n=1 Tax=Pelusios castaneus TaxID=367368 RepID=A0A8C8SYM7_9SAUR